MPQSVKAQPPDRPLRRTTPWGIQVGKLDGTLPPGARGFGRPPLGSVPGPLWRGAPTISTTLVPPGARKGIPEGWRGLTAGASPKGPGHKIVTWLILPVVICLSQRLSHACLSISNYTVKLRMAH